MSASFNYNTITRPISAGGSENFDITGTYVQVMEASHSNFKVRIDNGAENFYGVGIMIGDAVQLLPFKTITIVNYGAELTITIGHGSGPLRDGRVSFPGGNLAVVFDGPQLINFDGSQLVKFDGTQNVKFTTPQIVKLTTAQEVTFSNIARLEDSFNKLTEIVSLLATQSNNLSKGFVDLSGATFASAKNSTVTLATAAANTSGVMIHLFSGEHYTEAAYGSIFVDSEPITNISSSSGANTQQLENVFIPAGKKVELKSIATGRKATCWYEVL
jgi:hypothetical protein